MRTLQLLLLLLSISCVAAVQLPPGRGDYSTLSQLLAAHAAAATPRMPIVIFPEGQKSNGQCLLAWQQQPGECAAGVDAAGGASSSFDEATLRLLDGRIAELGCAYTGDEGSETRHRSKRKHVHYGLPHTVHSPTKHLLHALAEWQHPLLAVWATPADVQACVQQQQQAATAAGRRSSSGREAAAGGDTLLLLREVMVRMLPGRTPVAKTGADLASFSKYWEKTQREQYLKTK